MSTTGTVRGNYAKTAKRRRVILEASLDVFSNSGYRNGSIREIAEKVGISQAGLLHHFSSKSALLAAVLDLRDDEARVRIPVDPVTGIDTIRGFVDLVEYNASIPGLVELYCVLSAEATSAEHPAHQYFVDRYTYTIGITTEAFEIMKANGDLQDRVVPHLAAQNLIALMDGLQVQWLLNRDSVEMVENVRRFVRGLLTVEL